MSPVFGFLLSSFVLGYVLFSAVFPERPQTLAFEGFSLREDLRRSPTVAERLLISVLLSFAITSMIVLSDFAFGVSTGYGVELDLALSCLILLLPAYTRRVALDEEDRFIIDVDFDVPSWRGLSMTGKISFIVVAIGSIFSSAIMGVAVQIDETKEPFTEFYILGSEGVIDDYPDDLSVGETGKLFIGVANKEGEDIDYTIEVKHLLVSNDPMEERPGNLTPTLVIKSMLPTLPLQDGESELLPYQLVLMEEGLWRIEMTLYQTLPTADSSASNELHLWVRVTT